jgi:hypothetical protein
MVERGCLHSAQHNTIAVWILGALQSWRRLEVVEEMLHLHHGPLELALSYGHTVCQVNPELVEPGVV